MRRLDNWLEQKQRMEQMRKIGNKGAEEILRGMTLDEISTIAWKEYHMSYGKFIGYVHSTGRLPERSEDKTDEKDAWNPAEL